MKIQLKPIHWIIIALAGMIVILFTALVITANKKPIVIPERVDYEVFKKISQPKLEELQEQLIDLQNFNLVLLDEIDVLKSSIPSYKKELNSINLNIKKINDAYIDRNYSDSTVSALLERLSR